MALQCGLKAEAPQLGEKAQTESDDKCLVTGSSQSGRVHFLSHKRDAKAFIPLNVFWRFQMKSTQVAQILNLCAQFVTFVIYTWDQLFNVILLKHWFQEDRDWKSPLRYRDGDIKSIFYCKYCHLFLELSCLLFLVFPVNFVNVVVKIYLDLLHYCWHLELSSCILLKEAPKTWNPQ